MATSCKTWCGLTLVASLLLGLVILLAIYLLVRKITCKTGGGSTLSTRSPKGATEVSEDQANKLINGSTPVVIMVYADWCGHCKAMKPDFISVAKKMSSMANFVMVNGAKAKIMTQENGIDGFPCMLKYVGGKRVGKLMGRQSEDAIKSFAKS